MRYTKDKSGNGSKSCRTLPSISTEGTIVEEKYFGVL